MKSIIALVTLAMFSNSFAYDEKLEIRGCHVTIKTLRKTVEEGSSVNNRFENTMAFVFDAESRQGYGTAMTKKSNGDEEFYIGKADIDGGILEVEVSTFKSSLNVKATIKKISGEKVEVSAIGSANSAIIPSFNSIEKSSELTAMLGIQNPLVVSIIESDKSVSDPLDSVLFPTNTMIFAGADVYCFADFK